MKKNRIVVVGGGVVGSILAAHLIRNKEEVVLADSLKCRLKQIKEKGLSILDPGCFTHGHFTAKANRLCFSLSEAVRRGVDTVFICVKTFAIQSLLSEIREICQRFPRVKVVSFQNGLDTEELLAHVAGRKNVLRGVVNYAGRMNSAGEVEITFFNKPNYIGELEAESIPYAKDICRFLNLSGLNTKYSHEIKKQVWEKVVLNSTLSPVSALTGMTMRQIMECEWTRGIVIELAREAIEVAKASGISLADNFQDFCVSYLTKAGHHKPSMLLDVETKSQTEIEFLNGKICEYAGKNKVPVPFHRTILCLIKGLERRFKLTEKRSG